MHETMHDGTHYYGAQSLSNKLFPPWGKIDGESPTILLSISSLLQLCTSCKTSHIISLKCHDILDMQTINASC